MLASAAAVAIAIVAGFPAATLAALACYLVALAHAALGRWRQREPAVAPVPAAGRPGRARRGGRSVSPRVVLLPGDGIGPEIAAVAVDVLRAVADDLAFEEHPFGGVSIDRHGTALTDATLAACRAADAVLLAAVGGPRWDTTDPGAPRPEQGLLGLRRELGLYANLRPVKAIDALLDASPLRREVVDGTDLLVVRELTGGIYFGAKTRTADEASDDCRYTRGEVERIARVAFRAARSKVVSVDKANVLETSRLWREVVRDVHAREFPHVELEHALVDSPR